MTVSALTVDSAVRDMDLGAVIEYLSVSLAQAAKASNNSAAQILPLTSFCIRLAMSTSRRQACSRNDIIRSMSWSLGSGISILRSPSATFGSGFFSESAFGSGFVDFAGDDRIRAPPIAP